jgi:hypothetical protein
MKKRKPRLNTNSSSIMPYRYVLIKIKSVAKVGEKDEFGYSTFEVVYTFAKTSYYYDVYGDKEFNTKVVSKKSPYYVDRNYLIPMTIDID